MQRDRVGVRLELEAEYRAVEFDRRREVGTGHLLRPFTPLRKVDAIVDTEACG